MTEVLRNWATQVTGNRKQLFWLLSAVFVLLNWQHLANPPYWDEILGLHNQALFLAQNSFDYASLWQSGAFADGGSCIYPLGLMPTVYAVFYRLLSPLWVHIAGHLLNILFCAGAMTLFIQLVRKRTDGLNALLWGLVAFANPIFNSQLAAQNQEAPLLFFVMLSIFFRGKKRPKLAIFWAVFAAIFIKNTAAILLMAYLTVDGFYLIYDRSKAELKKTLPSMLFALFAILIAVVIFSKIGTGTTAINWSFYRIGWIIVLLIPIPFAAAILALTALFIRSCFSFNGLRNQPPEVLLSAVFFTGFTAAFLLVADHSLPRYYAVAILPVTLVLANELYRIRYQKAVAAALILLQFANSYGALLPTLPDIYRKEGSMLERSREFLADLEANRQIMALLEREAANRAIVGKMPYLAMLTIPEFRYVNTPLPEVYSVGLHPNYAPVKPYSPKQTPSDALILFSADTLWGAFSLRPGKESSILFVEDEDRPAAGIILYTNAPQNH